jgi:hypothetical protein
VVLGFDVGFDRQALEELLPVERECCRFAPATAPSFGSAPARASHAPQRGDDGVELIRMQAHTLRPELRHGDERRPAVGLPQMHGIGDVAAVGLAVAQR